MKELAITVVGGILVIVIASALGIGKSTVTIKNSHGSSKLGKWLILLGVLMIIGGIAWAGNHPIPQGSTFTNTGHNIAIWGGLFFVVGWIINWFQK